MKSKTEMTMQDILKKKQKQSFPQYILGPEITGEILLRKYLYS